MSEVLKVGVVAAGHEHIVELILTVDDPDRPDWFGEDVARQFVAGPSETCDVIVAVLEGQREGQQAKARSEPGENLVARFRGTSPFAHPAK
jgi:hypothetical protein